MSDADVEAEAKYDAARRAYKLAFKRLRAAKAAYESVQWRKIAEVLDAGPITQDFYSRCRDAGVQELGRRNGSKNASDPEILRLVDKFITAYLPGKVWRMDTTQSLSDNSAEAVRLALERYHATEQTP